ncbi:hypothetical protein ABZ371_06150 [Streptomyces sp. NPDC005899]|uniref:hypothetical protein n=1 Tax=Streptomyces sp. NPDC005899 TaxID=3155716 RepID=UPI0033EAAB6D
MHEPRPHDARPARTRTEELLVRALAARAGQITHHSLRPGAPPVGNWAARGRGPLLMALAASVAGVALVGGAVMTLTAQDPRPGVATAPTTGMSTPAPLPSAPAPSTPPASPSGRASSPSGEGVVVPPPEGDTAPARRTVKVVYGPQNATTTLRTGGAARVFEATVTNIQGEPAEDAADILTVTAGAGTLRPGYVRVSVYEAGAWKPVGGTDSGGYTAELARGSLADGAERTVRVRVQLGSDLPGTIDDLRVSFFSDGGSETFRLSG